MENQQVIDLLTWAIGPGSGVVVAGFMTWLITEMSDGENGPSPKTKRRLTYLVSLLLPSILYGALAWLSGQYNPVAHITAVLAAFGISQGIHGEKYLLSGKQVAAKKQAAYARAEQAVSSIPIPQGHSPGMAVINRAPHVKFADEVYDGEGGDEHRLPSGGM